MIQHPFRTKSFIFITSIPVKKLRNETYHIKTPSFIEEKSLLLLSTSEYIDKLWNEEVGIFTNSVLHYFQQQFSFLSLQVPHVGLHTMIVFGAFFCGGVTALTGTLQYLPPKGTFTDPDMEFLVLAFILRSIYALGYAAFSAAGMTILSVVFPDTTTTILVGTPVLSFLLTTS